MPSIAASRSTDSSGALAPKGALKLEGFPLVPVASQLRFERRLKWMTAWVALPALLGMSLLLWSGGFSAQWAWTLGILVGLATLIAAVKSPSFTPTVMLFVGARTDLERTVPL